MEILYCNGQQRNLKGNSFSRPVKQRKLITPAFDFQIRMNGGNVGDCFTVSRYTLDKRFRHTPISRF